MKCLRCGYFGQPEVAEDLSGKIIATCPECDLVLDNGE
jgi:hypothetical protein